jgi:hypothetical protein
VGRAGEAGGYKLEIDLLPALDPDRRAAFWRSPSPTSTFRMTGQQDGQHGQPGKGRRHDIAGSTHAQ